MQSELYAAARSGHLILTANDRLTRYLAREYDLAQQASGLSCWLRPQIFSFSGWLFRLHQQLPEPPHLLNKAQLQQVWEQIIEEDVQRHGNILLQVPQTAIRARQAHTLLLASAAEFDPSLSAEDHRAFLRWRKTWRQQAARHDWHDPAELPDRIASAIADGTLHLPEQVVLAGFDEIPPDLERVCRSLTSRGVPVSRWQPTAVDLSQPTRVDANDPEQEVTLCARWVRQILLQDPAARIGIVVPQLEAYQSLIEQIFTAQLAPQAFVAGEEARELFNVSLGHRLDDEGVVLAALRLLRLHRQLDQTDLTWLLTTPYTAGVHRESALRARLDRELRRRYRQHTWSLASLVKVVAALGKTTQSEVPAFHKILQNLVKEQQRSRKRLPGAWAEHFSNLLDQLGWPGERGLNSREYQAVGHFRQALTELASLDGIRKSLERAEAVSILSRLVAGTDFQPEGPEAPVQVLGLLESGGLSFDHLWVLGLHDTALPSLPRPNPFIPLPVQRRYRMSRCDAEREMAFADQAAHRLFSAAPQVILSWPHSDHGVNLRPSPYLADIPPDQPTVADTAAPATLIHDKQPAMEIIVDTQGPPLARRKPFSGGTTIIKDQALCPFRAFAHHRLRAEALDTPEPGIDNLSRGTLAHTVLELFWKEVGDLQTLHALDAAQRSGAISRSVEAALKRLEAAQRSNLPDRQRQLEQERLDRVVQRWLTIEEKRQNFRVLGTEETFQVELGGLSIRTRIDRIDQLSDGSLAIIDYKTGRPDPTEWLTERITEPQLPIYALGQPRGKIGAVMFAVVRSRSDESGFRGLAKDPAAWPQAGSRTITQCFEEMGWTGLEDVLDYWQQALSNLGTAFARGDAVVDPIGYERACRYCDLTSLCRILEAAASEGRGGDD
ncbi:MAG: PD-(D/E)XK nuclease family protein [Desulfuromonadales bacterium]